MAPSSTPYDASRRSLLAARDARQDAIERWVRPGETVVAVSLAIPGEDKTPAGADALFAWAVGELARALPGARCVHAAADALGPFGLWSTAGEPATVKARCVAVEAGAPSARLVDLDVYSPQGAPMDRASLQLPPRECLCCAAPARECIRVGRHGAAELADRVRALLAGLASR
jgi:holo-ACP synthase